METPILKCFKNVMKARINQPAESQKSEKAIEPFLTSLF